MVRPFNAFQWFNQGVQARANHDQVQQQNALRGLMREQGPAMMQGDPNALNALAQYDPGKAMQMRQGAVAQKEEAAKRLVQMVAGAQDKPGAYARARQYAQQIGLDVSAFPEQWGPDVEQQIEVMSRVYAMPDQERTEFERLISGLPEEMRGRAVMTRLGLMPRATAPSEVDTYGFRVPQGYRVTPDGQGVEPLPGYVPKGGQVIEMVDENGRTVRVGPAGAMGGSGLGKPAINSIEGLYSDANAKLSRLQNIERQFMENPDLERIFTYGGQVDDAMLKQMEKLSPTLLSEGERERLGDNTEFRQAIFDNLNRTIKEITGAAMTQQEAVRIGATEIGVDDSPTQARRKLQAAIRAQRAAMARLYMLKQQGMIDPNNPPGADGLGRAMDLGEVDRQLQAFQTNAMKMARESAARWQKQVDAGEITADVMRQRQRALAEQIAAAGKARFGI